MSRFMSEERLIPVVRARLAEKLVSEGFRVKDVAKALSVTQPAITQYLKRRRGAPVQGISAFDSLVDPLAEKLAKRIRSGLGGLETVELLDTARQVLVMSAGAKIAPRHESEPKRNQSLDFLRDRLRLELTAAEKYLELANKTSDDHTKLLLRMIASDSIRHGDVVSQIISWLETERGSEGAIPDQTLLESMLSIEDSAGEASLRENVDVDHPVARLLLRWIDIDEDKHGQIVGSLLGLRKKERKQPGRR